MTFQIRIDTLVILCGLIIGSFLNMCINRPHRKDGCVHYKGKSFIQATLVILLNCLGYVWIFKIHDVNFESVIYCLFTSVLIVVSFLDAKTLEIPNGCPSLIAFLGVIHGIMDAEHWKSYLIGAVCISGFLLILYRITKGRGIGGGDIKLMAASGFLIGAMNILVAFMLGCILAAVIHLIRMKVSGSGRQLAFGPYLCIGIWVAMLYGNELIRWYLST